MVGDAGNYGISDSRCMVQLILGMGTKVTVTALLSILLLGVVMWVYILTGKAMGRKGFEIELIAFFMSTISLTITASSEPERTFTQFVSVVIGLLMFFVICLFLRDLDRTERIRPIMAVASVLLLAFNLVCGQIKYGAANWVYIGNSVSQPSELVKIVFVLRGCRHPGRAVPEEEPDAVRAVFLLLPGMLGGDGRLPWYGTDFLVTFLVVSFLRSGDLSRLILTGVGAGIMGLMILRFMPYIANRFSICMGRSGGQRIPAGSNHVLQCREADSWDRAPETDI